MDNPDMTVIGLIADTHFQYYLFDLPTGLGEWFSDVDVILHAGDVGEIEVLNLLGKYAPIVAVHGNDEPEYVRQKFPDEQLLTFQGRSILLWHGHYSDPVEDKANRKGIWKPRLERIVNHALARNAKIVIFGHTHIPMVYRQDGITLINPGALTTGSYFTRQLGKTIAKLYLHADGSFEVVHIDVERNAEIILDEPNLYEDFGITARKYREWMVEPELIPEINTIKRIDYEDVGAVMKALIPLYKTHLKDGLISRRELIDAVLANEMITLQDKKSILNVLARQ